MNPELLYRLCIAFLRPPTTASSNGFIFDPPLDASEQAIFERLVRRATPDDGLISPDEWEVLEPRLASIRTHRTRSSAEWAGLTAAQRDSALIDWCRDLTDVLRAMLRD